MARKLTDAQVAAIRAEVQQRTDAGVRAALRARIEDARWEQNFTYSFVRQELDKSNRI